MKLSYSWLCDRLKDAPEPQIIADKLTSLGLEVEEMTDCDAAFDHFQVAEILTADDHPDADKLHVCKVRFDPKQEPTQIVCGAPNARPGVKVILARPGAVVPNGGFTIKVGSIRGVESQGMMCSWRELGLGQDDEGIAELSSDAPVGMPLAQYRDLGGTVMEIGLTPNRGDALSVLGIARELAAAGMGTIKTVDTSAVKEESTGKITLASNLSDASVSGRYVEGVKNTPSPDWLCDRLRTMDSKSQGSIVDVTNYVLFDLGRPMHAFDADKISDGLTLDHAKKGEKFEALNGETYTLEDGDIVFRDGKGNVTSLAGIIGGKASSVTQETKNIFLETSCLDPRKISQTARRLRISTDASHRFERGVDPENVKLAIDTAARLIIKISGGKAGSLQEAGKTPTWKRMISVRPQEINEIIGRTIPVSDLTKLAEQLGFQVIKKAADVLELQVPSWRNDIASIFNELARDPSLPKLDEKKKQEIDRISAEHEFAGEVARHLDMSSYPRLISEQDEDSQVGKKSLKSDADARYQRDTFLRSFLASRGLYEIVGFSFTGSEKAKLFEDTHRADTIMNPLSKDLTQMRPTLLPNMLEALSKNIARGCGERAETCFFEIGPAFGAKGHRLMATGIRGGFKPRSLERKREEFSWKDVKEDAMLALEEMGISASSLGVEKGAPSYFHPGRSGKIMLGPKNVLGYFGQLHPDLCEAFDIDNAVSAFELDLQNVPLPKKRKSTAALPDLQPIRKDVAFIVDKDVPVEKIVKAIAGADRKHIQEVSLFDVFEGGSLEQGKKSVAAEIVFQPQKVSFTDEEIALKLDMVSQSVNKACGGILRDK